MKTLVLRELPKSSVERKRVVAAILDRYQVPFQTWGQGSEAKTFPEFLHEVSEGELILHEVDNQLVATSERVLIYVTFSNGEKTWEIVDALQQYESGRIRNRGTIGIREKLHAGEAIEMALLRALNEESGGLLNPNLDRFTYLETTRQKLPKAYKAYPGLLELRTIYSYSLVLTKEEMERSLDLPEKLFPNETMGFIEEQKGIKICYYRWQEQLSR